MANNWRLFRSRYAGLFDDVSRQYPSFWTELGDLIERRRQQQFTTEGAQVREFPPTRERSIQTEKTWSVDQALYEVFGQNFTETSEATTQTPKGELRDMGMQTLPPTQRTSGAQTSPPDCYTREAQTPPLAQSTVGTQVEMITTAQDLVVRQTGVLGGTGSSRGRGRGLRPISIDELMPVRLGGPSPSVTPPPSDRQPRGASPGRPKPGGERQRASERRSRSTTQRPTREDSRERSQHRRSPTRKDGTGSAERQVGRRSSRSVVPTRGATVCWNCRATDHRYSNCPRPRDSPYCYGCGRRGETMRTCPACGTEWRNLGPYRPEQGHLGNRELEFP